VAGEPALAEGPPDATTVMAHTATDGRKRCLNMTDISIG
jgi:hypothetical protein